ncbi:SDR family oxidoreductase [Novosphingobium album (ex Hu et al. 2023)]|uniref:SDR family oxidoreductase n=1 Tax=Novosphingobium album (ex Hu et al. 2023) TaxID=2930093 RepID=A0ABT0B6A7_9SPHN|nr:SDR family oxidoreductase [Novosphingobium album (ex Hu et al. 2023)]MCJ2180622.1 SDR family oxidoreductase [Novosphingobium album (ex Hu et al. 2023)]
MTSSVLVIGARSDIGLAAAHRFATAGYSVQLAARNVAQLEADAADIALRHGVSVTMHELDLLAADTFEAFADSLPVLPQVAICAVGLLGDQVASQSDLAAASLVMRSNYEGPALITGLLAERFEARGSGTLVGISSVAGDRGRASNYVYGSAKAGYTAFLSGLRNRLAKKNVHVLTVLPGFVRTRMTEGMDLPARLIAEPGRVAEAIFAAVLKKRDVIYVKPVWRLVMGVIRSVPERVFKGTQL